MEKKTKDIYEITSYLANEIFRDYYGYVVCGETERDRDKIRDLLDIIASLHNLLYEKETGKRYDYMWHWANKDGGWCDDNFFDLNYEREDD